MIPKTEKIWMNGELVDWDEAKLPVLALTLHYGMGVFEGIRAYRTDRGPAVFRLDDHVTRLLDSAGLLSIDTPFGFDDYRQGILDTIGANKLEHCYIRPIIFYGLGGMGLYPAANKVESAIAVWPWGKLLAREEVKVMTSSYIRIHPKSTHSGAKVTGHYVNSILAVTEAHKAGFDEALLLDYNGNVAEGPAENIFIVEDRTLCTPPPGSILLGITRDTVIALGRELGYKVVEEEISPKRLREADEAFFTGTAAEVAPIASIDGRPFGNGRVGATTAQIKSAYLDIVFGRNSEHSGWLTPVDESQ